MHLLNSPFKKSVAFGIAIIGVGICFYVSNFARNGISKDPADWGVLGDYMNFFVSIASLIVVSVLTFTIHEIEQERGKTQEKEANDREEKQLKFQQEIQSQRQNFEYALERLIFKVDVKDNNKWKIANIGCGAALNMLVAHTNDGMNWIDPVKCYSLQSGESLDLSWQYGVNKWKVRFSDIFENLYTSTCEHDETTIEDGDSLSFIPDTLHQRLDETIKKNKLPFRVY